MRFHPSGIVLLLMLGLSRGLQAQYPQSPTRGNYKPPVLSETTVQQDPGIQKAFTHLSNGDFAGFLAELSSQAEAGNAAAQLMLGEQYVPKEKYGFDPPADRGFPPPRLVPSTESSPLSSLFPPSYTDALKWLTLASAQGSGEASEIVAQLITRMTNEHQPSTFTAADAARYRSLAIQQGYDLEEATVRCYHLTKSAVSLACTGRASFLCPTEEEMQSLRQTGLTGELKPEGGASGGLTSITLHPEGVPAHALIILDHTIDTEQRFPLPRHTSAIYVQQAKSWLTLPGSGPTLSRDIVLTPGPDAFNAVMVYVQNIDGSRSGGSCFSNATPR